jgi:hypothetical protein
VQILRHLLAFGVWLGWMYLMAMINEALFAIFLGCSMIIGGIYIPPRLGRNRPEQLAIAYEEPPVKSTAIRRPSPPRMGTHWAA